MSGSSFFGSVSIKATEVGDDALAHRAGVGAEGLDNLQIAPATGRLIRVYMLRR